MSRKSKFAILIFALLLISIPVVYRTQIAPMNDGPHLLLDTAGRNQLHLAVQFGCSDFHPDAFQMKELIEQAILIVKDVNLRDKSGNTALHYACTPEVVDPLLSAGADPTAENNEGQTVLMTWINTGFDNYHEEKLDPMLDVNVLKKVLDRGLNINEQDRDGKTALHYLIGGMSTFGGEEVLKHKATLVKLGADPNIVDHRGQAPSLEREPSEF